MAIKNLKQVGKNLALTAGLFAVSGANALENVVKCDLKPIETIEVKVSSNGLFNQTVNKYYNGELIRSDVNKWEPLEALKATYSKQGIPIKMSYGEKTIDFTSNEIACYENENGSLMVEITSDNLYDVIDFKDIMGFGIESRGEYVLNMLEKTGESIGRSTKNLQKAMNKYKKFKQTNK